MREARFSVVDGSHLTIQAGGASLRGSVIVLLDGSPLLELSPSDAGRLAGALTEIARTARHEVAAEHARRRTSPAAQPLERCADCGEPGERTGHQTCQYPQDHE